MHSHALTPSNVCKQFTLYVNTNELLHNTLKWGVSSLKAGYRMTLIGMTIQFQSSTTSTFSHLNYKFVNNNKHPYIINNKIQHPSRYVLKPHTNIGYNGTMCTIEMSVNNVNNNKLLPSTFADKRTLLIGTTIQLCPSNNPSLTCSHFNDMFINTHSQLKNNYFQL